MERRHRSSAALGRAAVALALLSCAATAGGVLVNPYQADGITRPCDSTQVGHGDGGGLPERAQRRPQGDAAATCHPCRPASVLAVPGPTSCIQWGLGPVPLLTDPGPGVAWLRHVAPTRTTDVMPAPTLACPWCVAWQARNYKPKFYSTYTCPPTPTPIPVRPGSCLMGWMDRGPGRAPACSHLHRLMLPRLARHTLARWHHNQGVRQVLTLTSGHAGAAESAHVGAVAGMRQLAVMQRFLAASPPCQPCGR